MPAGLVGRIEGSWLDTSLLTRLPRVAPAPARPVLRSLSPTTSAAGAVEGRLQPLIDDLHGLCEQDVEYLARTTLETAHDDGYAEALLAARQAAERSGRTAAVDRAAGVVEMLIVRAAAPARHTDLDDRARWAVLAERAAWAACDAARALAVGDLLPAAQLRRMTLAWDGFRAAQSAG